MADILHAPKLTSISAKPCVNCGGPRPMHVQLCDFCEKQEEETEKFLKSLKSQPWDENSFGVLAEKVFCDGCGEEIDPRQSGDLCFSCQKEAEAYED